MFISNLISKLEAEVSQALMACYPSRQFEVDFLVLKNLSCAELSSDCLIKAAKELGASTQDVFNALSFHLPSKYQAKIEADFLYLSLDPDLQIEFELPRLTQKYSLLLAPAHGKCSGWAHLRVSLLAALNGFLLRKLGAEVEFNCAGKHFKVSSGSLSDIVRDLLLQLKEQLNQQHNPADWLAYFEDKILEYQERAIVFGDGPFWKAHDFEQLAKVKLVHPIHRWFYPYKDQFSIAQLLTLSDSALCDLVCRVSCSTIALDLDLGELGLNTSDNLPWFIHALNKRGSSLVDPNKENFKHTQGMAQFRTFMFFPHFCAQAASRGELIHFLDELHKALHSVNYSLSHTIDKGLEGNPEIGKALAFLSRLFC